MIYYYLHIFGTDHHDCKFLFEDKEKLLKYIQKLPLVKHTYQKKYLNETEDQVYRYEHITVENEDALKWWEDKINILKIDLECLPKYHKYFPAAFWDETPENHRKRIFG